MGVDRNIVLAVTRPQLGHAVFYGRDPATVVLRALDRESKSPERGWLFACLCRLD